jgi:hypothetical protein
MKDPQYILRRIHLETAGLMLILRDLENHQIEPEAGLEECSRLSELIQYMRCYFRKKIKERDAWMKRNMEEKH